MHGFSHVIFCLALLSQHMIPNSTLFVGFEIYINLHNATYVKIIASNKGL